MASEVKLSKLVQDNRSILEIYQGEEYIKDKDVLVSDIYRPGLELTGYFDFYPAQRIQLLGRKFLMRLDLIMILENMYLLRWLLKPLLVF